jgi:hypothetical protein
LACQVHRFSALLLKRVNLAVDLAVDLAVEAIKLTAAYCFCFLKCPNCCSIRPFLHHAFRAFASLDNVLLQLVSLRGNELFALLKTRSHSVDIAGQDRVSRAY